MTRSFRRTHIGDHALHTSTQMVSYGYEPSMSEGAVKPPVFLASTYVFQSAEEGADLFDVAADRKPAHPNDGAGGLVYGRFNHPNMEIVEDRLALLDGAECALLTASGMAAIGATILTLTRPGDAIVHYTPLYGGTEALLADAMTAWGVKPVPFAYGLSDAALVQGLEEARRQGPVKMVYLETPANPTNTMVDLATARRVVDQWSITSGQRPVIVCDNTMLGPLFQRPLELGIDICIYSLTKYVGGHSDLIAGGITGSRALLKPIRLTRSAFGFQLDPHSCWLLSRSLETLSLRMERAARSASRIAAWLARNSVLPCRVLHPEHASDPKEMEIFASQCLGPGSTFSFVIDDNRSLAFRVLDGLSLFRLAVSLGGTESLACHPASTTHSSVSADARRAAGISDGLIRLSVGLEQPEDLIQDLKQAFKKAVSREAVPGSTRD